MSTLRRLEEMAVALRIRDGAAEDLASAPRWKLVGEWASARRRDMREWNERLRLLGYCDVWDLGDPVACGARA